MKQKLTLCLLLLSLLGFSQSPDLINYQGIARDANGTAIVGTVDLKFDLHQGSANSATVFSEMQTVTTTTLGLFSTQIGKTTNLSSVNWQSGSLFLEVSLSLSGGTYTSLGTQQLVSVPYSMLAKSVPASYTNNVLTVGSNVFTLTPATGAVYTASTGISITSGSIITNTAPDVPVTFTSTSSNIAVNGPYPNFSISYTPSPSPTSLTLSGVNNNSLSAGSNTVVLNTYTTGSGLTMSGGPNYTISSSAANPTIVGLGAAVVSPTTGNSFSVSVANPTLSSSGNSITITQGTLVTTTTILSTPATSLLPGTNVNITGSNPYTIAAVPTLTLNGNNLSISGGNTVTLPTSGTIAAVTTSIVSTGAASTTVLAPNSFSIDVPLPNYASNGPVTISGTYPNYTINSSGSVTYTSGTGISITSGSIITNSAPNITPTIVVTTTAAAGASVTSSGSSFSINVPPAVISSLGNTLTVTQGTSVSTATISAGVASISPGGIANVSNPVTNSFVVSVPGPTFTSNGPTSITGTYPNLTVNSSAGTTYTNGTGISITSGSIINNTSPDQVVTLSNAGNMGITGSYPNFFLSAPSASFIPGGIVNISTLTANSFSIGVPNPTFTSNGPSSITGTYPNLTINSSAGTTYTNGSGISITSGSIISNTNPDQVVTLSNGGNIGITGSYPSFVLSAPSASFTPGGIVNISTLTANTFSIGVPNPTFTSNGPSSITGSYPNLTINSTAGTTYTNGSGISITSGSIITNTNPDQVVTLSNGGNIGITGSYPSFVLSAPSASFTPGGIVNISTLTANTYSIAVPNPTFTSNGPSSITGTYPNLTINSSAGTTYTGSTGISVSGSVITNTSPDQIVTISNAGNIGITGSYPSFALSAPSASFTPGGIVNISTITANSYSVSVPAPTLSIGAGNLSISGGNSVTLPVASIAVTFSSAANPSVSAAGNAYNINIPPAVAPNITISSSLAAAGISTTSTNNFNINVPSPNITISQTAAAVGISTTSANNYNINIPLANGAWGLLGNAGTVLGTNFIGTTDNTDLHFRTNNIFAMSINTLGSVGIGTTSAQSKLHVSNSSASAETGFFENTNSSATGHALVITSASSNQYALRTLNTSASLSSYAGMFEGGLIARGKNNASSAFAFKAQEIGGSDLFVIRNDGSVGIRNANPAYDLSIFNSGTSTSMQFRNGSSGSLGFIVGQNNVATNILSYETTPMYFGNGGTNQMVLTSAGNLGVGNMSPAAKLDVTGNAIITGSAKIVDGTQGANKVLTSDAAGNASWQNNGVPSGAIMAYGGTSVPTGWLLCDGTSYLRTTYSNLFTAIGTAWGAADATHFNVPDMRGMFLRGVDGAAGNDPDKASRTANNLAGNTGNNVGSEQTDEFASHTHNVPNLGSTVSNTALLGSVYTPGGTTTTTAAGGSTETRPKNVYVYYIIKQ